MALNSRNQHLTRWIEDDFYSKRHRNDIFEDLRANPNFVEQERQTATGHATGQIQTWGGDQQHGMTHTKSMMTNDHDQTRTGQTR
jgi:hypothetical protein